MAYKNRADRLRYQATYRQANRQKLLADQRARREADPEGYQTYMRQWRQDHRAHVAAYDATYRATHTDQIRTQERKHDSENREAVRAKNNTWYQNHAGPVTARIRTRRAANPEPYRARDRKRTKTPRRKAQLSTQRRQRRAAIANAPVNDLTHAQWLEIQAAQHHCCYYCQKRCKGKLTQDHVTPLSQGGSHTLQNVVAACRSCNCRKGAKPPPIAVQMLLLTGAPSRTKKVS